MAKAILNPKELDHLADVIGEIEQKTAGEIRLMIVKRSIVTGHVQRLLWFLLILFTFVWIWNFRYDLVFYERWWWWPTVVFVQYFIAVGLSRFEWVQRNLTSAHDMHHQVWARAEVEFHREGLSDTSKHTGVLVFLSLLERYAVVLADKAMAEKVPAHTWDKTVETIVAGARTGRWAEKIEQALRECGSYLAEHFPPELGKSNELPNTVILKD